MPAAAATRCLLAIAAARGWHVNHLDIRTAYLYAPMDMEVYISIPEGIDDAGEDALLDFALYATKQEGNLWGKHLSATLTTEGATRSSGERCLFIYLVFGKAVYVEAHADDLLIVGADLDAVEHVKCGIERHCEVRDLREVKNYLGMEVKWNHEAGTVSHANPRHIVDILNYFQMEDCNPVKALMVRGSELGAGDPSPENNRYVKLAGSLSYLSNQTTPDIAFAVGRLARRMVHPTEGHWALAKRVFRYLKEARNMGIKYGQALELGGWVDSDPNGDLGTRKSTTCYVFTLHRGAVSWHSRLERLVATSTTTADYIAAAEGFKESQCLRRIVGSVGEDAGPVTLHEDNQACIAMAGHVVSSPQTKHVDLCYHFLRDCVARGKVVLEYIGSEEQVAEGFTKPLSLLPFTRFRQRIGVYEV